MIVKRCKRQLERTLDARISRSEVIDVPSDLPLLDNQETWKQTQMKLECSQYRERRGMIAYHS